MQRALPALVLHAALCVSKLALHADAATLIRTALTIAAQLHEAGDAGDAGDAGVRLAAVGLHMLACELYASARPVGSSSVWSRQRCAPPPRVMRTRAHGARVHTHARESS